MIAVLVMLGILAGGLYLLYREYRQSHSYLTTWGKVLASELSTKQIQEGGVRPASFRPKVRYEYTVEGKQYVGDRITLVMVKSSNKESMARQLERYPEGATVQVHYDPEDPGRAVLETGYSWLSLLLTAIGLLGTLLAAFLLWKYWLH